MLNNSFVLNGRFQSIHQVFIFKKFLPFFLIQAMILKSMFTMVKEVFCFIFYKQDVTINFSNLDGSLMSNMVFYYCIFLKYIRILGFLLYTLMFLWGVMFAPWEQYLFSVAINQCHLSSEAMQGFLSNSQGNRIYWQGNPQLQLLSCHQQAP